MNRRLTKLFIIIMISAFMHVSNAYALKPSEDEVYRSYAYVIDKYDINMDVKKTIV